MSAPSLTTLPSMAARMVIAICAITLLATAVPGVVAPAAGADLGSQISSGRRSQKYYESQMQAQDRQLVAIKRQAKAARRAFKQAKRSTKRTRHALAVSKKVVSQRRARAKAVTDLFSNKADAPKPWRYEKRLRQVRTDLRLAERRKGALGRRLRATQRSVRARGYRVASLRRQQRTAVYRREAAEGALGGLISQMTRLAAARVRSQTTVSLTNGSGSFSWPSTGRITQTYGCTGFRLNPSKGSCRHFHDGLDIVDSYGTAIRAAAVGVVAFAGWNPYDEGGRAWIVVVVHPNGFVTRYGHLVPSKRVRAGALVHTGQVIGKMGSTGNSTGTHLHFELLRGGSTVSPLSYLPSGVVKIKVDKKSTKKGLAKSRRKARVRERGVAKRQAAKERRQAKRAKAKATKSSKVAQAVCDAGQVERAAGTGVLRAVALVSDTGPDGSTVACVTEPIAPTTKAASKVASKAGAATTAARASTSSGATTASNAIAGGSSSTWGISSATARNDERAAPASGLQGVRVPARGTSPLPS